MKDDSGSSAERRQSAAGRSSARKKPTMRTSLIERNAGAKRGADDTRVAGRAAVSGKRNDCISRNDGGAEAPFRTSARISARTPARTSPRAQLKKLPRPPFRLPSRALMAIIAAAAVALVVVIVLATRGSEPAKAYPTIPERTYQNTDVALLDLGLTPENTGTVTFCAVGDNLANENILELAKAWGGDDASSYDFSPLYENVKSVIQGYDIAFVNQETTLGGDEDYDYSGYPSYNTPDSMADALIGTGFDVVSTNTNHTYDIWTDAILHSQKVWSEKDNVLTIGSYSSSVDRARVRVVQCNGLRIAFLSYCYGQNGYEQSELPNDFYAVPATTAELAQDIDRAKQASDFVVVYLHSGTEYTNEPNEEQRTFAQACADSGAGMVVCSHAHVIQPLEWIERSDGGQMLCAWGLGDFVSGYHDNPDTILSGMLSCSIHMDEQGAISVEDVKWVPLIEHWQGESDSVRLVKDYTQEDAQNNELLSSLEDPYGWIRETTERVIGDDFAIDM